MLFTRPSSAATLSRKGERGLWTYSVAMSITKR